MPEPDLPEPDFLPGITLKRANYEEAVRPILAERFPALALAGLPVRSDFILQELAHVGQNGSGDDHIDIDRQSTSHEFLHRLSALAGNMHYAPLVLHEVDGTVRYQQSEGDIVQIVGFQWATFKRLRPGLGDLLTQFSVLNPLDFRPQLVDRLTHSTLPKCETQQLNAPMPGASRGWRTSSCDGTL